MAADDLAVSVHLFVFVLLAHFSVHGASGKEAGQVINGSASTSQDCGCMPVSAGYLGEQFFLPQ